MLTEHDEHMTAWIQSVPVCVAEIEKECVYVCVCVRTLMIMNNTLWQDKILLLRQLVQNWSSNLFHAAVDNSKSLLM